MGVAHGKKSVLRGISSSARYRYREIENSFAAGPSKHPKPNGKRTMRRVSAACPGHPRHMTKGR